MRKNNNIYNIDKNNNTNNNNQNNKNQIKRPLNNKLELA
jgi:hypothetical protein